MLALVVATTVVVATGCETSGALRATPTRSSTRSSTRITAPASSASTATRGTTRRATTTSTSAAATSPRTSQPATADPTTTTFTVAVEPAFSASVSAITAADLAGSYHPGCPVGPAQLRLLRLSYWGFDDRAHRGAMVVNEAVAQSVISMFARLYTDRFPIRRMEPVDAFGGSDPASMAADNTSGFNCRDAVAPGPPHWSVHAYGEAIDVNPVENPYLEAGRVQPAAGAGFMDRSVHRRGMAYPGGALVSAFAAAGWAWGGRWSSSPDYQHFSANGG